MADGFGAPRYGQASYCGPSPLSRCVARAHFHFFASVRSGLHVGADGAGLRVNFPRTTRGARPHHGAMACGPVDAGSCFCEACKGQHVFRFSTSRTVMHATSHGHISVLRQRALATSYSSLLTSRKRSDRIGNGEWKRQCHYCLP